MSFVVAEIAHSLTARAEKGSGTMQSIIKASAELRRVDRDLVHESSTIDDLTASG